jgi:hypothetical protein
MHGEVEQQTFDAVERELIRKKLIRYMKENGIGAPTLAERIQDSHPRKTEIPLSTLQRFLAGWGKNESCVALCHRFVERVVISDPVAKLGERLSIFYGAGNGHDYSGDYVIEHSRKDDPFGLKYPEPVMEITPDAGFWRVTERRYSDPDDTIYDGVLVCSGDVAVVVMKGRLMGLARNYTLWHEKYLLHARGVKVSFKGVSLQKLAVEQISFRLGKRR